MRKRNPNTRYKEVCVRLTDAEYRELVRLCGKTGMSKPDVLRTGIRHVRRNLDHYEYRKYLNAKRVTDNTTVTIKRVED